MASFAMDEFGAKKAYVLSMLGDDYTVGLAKNFVKAFEEAGGEIVADETFVEGTADFSAYLNNAVSGGADVIFAPSAIAYAPQIIEQASALGVSLPILGGDTWENSAISDAQNGTDMQVFVSTFFDENDESGLAKEFVSGYKAWLNGNAQNLTNNGGNDVVAAVSALGYDAYMAAVAAIEKAQSTDGTAIRDALAGLSIDAVTGALSFDANGDAVKKHRLHQAGHRRRLPVLQGSDCRLSICPAILTTMVSGRRKSLRPVRISSGSVRTRCRMEPFFIAASKPAHFGERFAVWTWR